MRVYIVFNALRVFTVVAAALMLGCSKDPQASPAPGPSDAAGVPFSAQDAQPDPPVSAKGVGSSGGVVGVIHYRGVINGTVRFHSSDCAVIEHSALPGPPFQGLDAPDTQSDASGHPPRLGVVPYGGRWHIMFNAPLSAADDPRKTVLSAIVKHGVKIVHHHKQWKVVLNHIRARDLEALTKDLSSSMPKTGFTEITGEINCQRLD